MNLSQQQVDQGDIMRSLAEEAQSVESEQEAADVISKFHKLADK
jgi:hypothetical protein